MLVVTVVDQACNGQNALAAHLPPDWHAINTEILGKDAHRLRLQILIASGTI
ncbi:MAG TPA: hypothetical protein VF503_13935 [Sphingobium sp.]|uniref:hypothetical protein n=1 Tax=Sphingobium sp. TaxID=1912891 RepID=UPI002ED4839C